MRSIVVALCIVLAGCASTSVEGPEEVAPLSALAEPVAERFFEGSQAWPQPPQTRYEETFEVPHNTTDLLIGFNWQGQQPGGYSSNRAGYLLSPGGERYDFTGPDLPLNPYLCASSTCGPAQDRTREFEHPEPGVYTIVLEGLYTATAFYYAEAVLPA